MGLGGQNLLELESLQPQGPLAEEAEPCALAWGGQVRGQMVSGEWVSDYSKRLSRLSIPPLRLGLVSNCLTGTQSLNGADAEKR